MSKSAAKSDYPATLQKFVAKIRKKHGGSALVPHFDPTNGNLRAKYLLVLESPGPKAAKTGLISIDNPDPTARNLKLQLSEAGVRPADLAIWNVVPWRARHHETGNVRPVTAREVTTGVGYLVELVTLMKRLRCVVLVGAAASKAHVKLSAHVKVRVLACHHPSQQRMNTKPEVAAENIAVFKRMRS